MIDAIAAPVTPEVSVNTGTPQPASTGSETGQFADALNSAMKTADTPQAEKMPNEKAAVEVKPDETKVEPDQESTDAESMAASLLAQLLQQVPAAADAAVSNTAGQVEEVVAGIGEQTKPTGIPVVSVDIRQVQDMDVAQLLAQADTGDQPLISDQPDNAVEQVPVQQRPIQNNAIPVQQKVESVPTEQVQFSVEKIASGQAGSANSDVATFRLMAQMDPRASIAAGAQQATAVVSQVSEGNTQERVGTNAAVSAFGTVASGQITADKVVSAVDLSDKSGNDTNSSTDDNGESAFNLLGTTGSQTKTGETVQANRAESATRADADLHTKIIDQVVQEIKLKRFDGGGDLMVKLTPPELGTLRIQISQHGGILASQIHADNDTVKALLQANLPQLMDALTNSGLKMDSISVHTESPFSSFAQNMSSHSGAQQQANSNGRQRFASQPNLSGVSGAADLAASNMSAVAASNAGYSWLV